MTEKKTKIVQHPDLINTLLLLILQVVVAFVAMFWVLLAQMAFNVCSASPEFCNLPRVPLTSVVEEPFCPYAGRENDL